MPPHSQAELPLGLIVQKSQVSHVPKLGGATKPQGKASDTVRLSHEIAALQALDPTNQLMQCEARLGTLAHDLAGGSSKVLQGALLLAFVAEHELWKITGPAYTSPIEFGVSVLGAKGVGSSTHNIRRLLKIGALGLKLHANGLPLPENSASLQAVLDAKLKDQIEGCRRLVAAHEARFPDAAAVEAFFGKAQKCTEDVGQQSPWRTVKTWTDEGVDLVDQGASRQQVRDVFKKIGELAKARCGAGKPKKRKRTTPVAKGA